MFVILRVLDLGRFDQGALDLGALDFASLDLNSWRRQNHREGWQARRQDKFQSHMNWPLGKFELKQDQYRKDISTL